MQHGNGEGGENMGTCNLCAVDGEQMICCSGFSNPASPEAIAISNCVRL